MQSASQVKEHEKKMQTKYLIAVASEIKNCDLEMDGDPQAFVVMLSEMCWNYTSILCTDVEAFAKHRKVKTVDMQDVLLVARRSEAAQEMLELKKEQVRDLWSV